MIDINNITIGSDPEFAAFDKNGTPISAVGFIPGTKKEPYPLTEDGEYSIQIDNVGVEGCIPPARTKEEFVNSMLKIKDLTEKELQKKRPDLHLRSVSSARYSKKELSSKTAQLFGCDPSWDVYTMRVSERPTPEEVGNLRSFGCHIHVGFTVNDNNDDVFDYARKIIKAMDITLGLPSLFIDGDEDRATIYGNPGDLRFRQIEHINIVEYRTLGGAMHDNADILSYIYDQTILAVNMANNWSQDLEEIGDVVKGIISSRNYDMAKTIMNQFNIPNVSLSISTSTTSDKRITEHIGG